MNPIVRATALALASAVFTLAAQAAPQATLKVINDFSAAKLGGGCPVSELTLGPDGRYWGTTCEGTKGSGSVYATDVQGHTSVLHNFTADEGQSLTGPLAVGVDGTVYGTGYVGGSTHCGTFWTLTAAGSFTLVHTFQGTDGCGPNQLSPGSDGAFYGVASSAGPMGGGEVFRITPAGAVTVIHAFVNGGDGTEGYQPFGALLPQPDGTFVGVTAGGGPNNEGTVYQVGIDGSFHTVTFFDATHTPYGPVEGLRDGGDGWLYGMAREGLHKSPLGSIYRVNLAGTVENLYNFEDGAASGFSPTGRLLLGSTGNFYGVTSSGGASGVGVVFQFGLPKRFAVLHSFDYVVDGANPETGLLETSPKHFIGAVPTGGPGLNGDTYLLKLH